MNQPATPRKPYDHALYLINRTNENITAVTTDAFGGMRALDGPTSAGVLAASSNLAIASALLAVADAIRAPRGDQ
ncbi:hypothetical protein ACIGCZ_29255 [Streptomyces nigra]|uniref:hypothetical protein n=1 Tax=Streptomyces nigra TaxID=1827580 RepID=UPI0037D67C35